MMFIRIALTCSGACDLKCSEYLLNNRPFFIFSNHILLQDLYLKIEGEVKHHMEQCSSELAKKQFPDNSTFLRELAGIWDRHSKQTVSEITYLHD